MRAIRRSNEHRRLVPVAMGLLILVGVTFGGFSLGSAAARVFSPGDRVPHGVSTSPGGGPSLGNGPYYPKNASGQTYGSTDAVAFDDWPDLILVQGTNGRAGYVDRAVLNEVTGANVSSPEEAVEWQRRMAAAAWRTLEIPVYGADGRARRGSFTVSRSAGAPAR